MRNKITGGGRYMLYTGWSKSQLYSQWDYFYYFILLVGQVMFKKSD